MNKSALLFIDKIIVTFIIFFFCYYEIIVNFIDLSIYNQLIYGLIILITPYAVYLTYKANLFQIFFWCNEE